MKKMFFLLGLFAVLATAFLVWMRVAQAGTLSDSGYVEIGYASKYGAGDAGLPTVSGEGYSPAKLTAAHAYLPMGALVKVTSPQTDKTVEVRINDRGPFKPECIIRVSGRAADLLGVTDWSAPVPIMLEAVDGPGVAGGEVRGDFYIQVGAFTSSDNAEKMVQALQDKGFRDFRLIQTIRGNDYMFKVQVGRFPVLSGARTALKKIRAQVEGAFIVSDAVAASGAYSK